VSASVPTVLVVDIEISLETKGIVMAGSKTGDDDVGPYASPACSMHEVDAAYMGISVFPGAERRANIMSWRKKERARLIAARLTIPAAERSSRAKSIASQLDVMLPALTGCTVGLYWPLRGEPDLRDWLSVILRRGALCALPVVVEKNAPLIYRSWRPGEPLTRGFWNIPVPEHGEILTPDVVLAPVVGFDENRFRLGYGGGYFDRTLAHLPKRPHVIGIGYAQAALKTIYPLEHDIPMDAIVTECGP
jgi:5-formyltetrahydrofolate cyclo-ligase